MQVIGNLCFWIIFKAFYQLISISLFIALLGIPGCSFYSNTKSSESWMGECDLESLAKLNYQENRKTQPVAINYSMNYTQQKYFLINQKIAKKDSVGERYVRSMNRAQQAYFSENNEFATNLKDLELGIESETEFYTFKIVPQYGFPQSVKHIAQAKREYLKNYIGLVLVTTINGEKTTISKYCETQVL